MDTLEHSGRRETLGGRFQRDGVAQGRQAAIDAIFKRKNFPEILEMLYIEKTVRQKDMVEKLGICKGTICLSMNELDAAGFVQQRKEGRCKTYHLLRKGAEYYETHFLQARPSSEDSVIRDCLGGNTEPLQDALVNILDRMDRALETLSEDGSEPIWTQRARESLADAERLANAFQAVAGRNDMLLYYYMGEYRAKLDWLKEALKSERDSANREAVTRGRHFETILRLLYAEKSILKKDMVEKLGISAGNTFLHLKGMIETGFVVEGREGMCRSYRLSPDGERYYEDRF